MKPDLQAVVTLLVDNEFGVLTRVTALIRREGWNIRTLTVAETESPEISRMTICLECRLGTLEHLLERLKRQSSVRELTVFSPETQVAQELCIVRVNGGDPQAVERLRAACGGEIMDRSGGDVMLAFRCEPHVTEEILKRCRAVGLREVARSGSITLRKGGAEDGREEAL